MTPEGVAPSLTEGVDREARGHGRDDRVVAARRLDLVEDVLLDREVLGQGLEDQVRVRDGSGEVVLVVAGRDAQRDGRRTHLLDRGGEALVGLGLRARQEGHLGHGRREERTAPVAHRPVRAEHDDTFDLAAGQDLPHLRGAHGGMGHLDFLCWVS